MALSKADQVKMAKIMNDPVAWAQAFLRTFNSNTGFIEPWRARWYQVEMMRDNSKKRVYRCGRRTGKCLPGWVDVIDYKTGERIKVEELYNRHKAYVVTMNDDYTLGVNFTNEVLDNGKKEVFRVTTKTGRYIDATGNHPLFTGLGWTEIDDLKPGMKVALPSHLNYWGKEKVKDNEAKLLAYIIGNGNCTQKTIRFSANNDCPKILSEMKSICAYYDCQLKQYDYNSSCDYNITKIDENINNKTIKNNIKEVLIENQVFGKSSKEKKIPSKIFRSNKRTAALFLSRLYATDGWCHFNDEKYEIGYCTVSEQLARDIQHLLLKFGINSYIKTKKTKYKGSYNCSFNVNIYQREDIMTFINNINIYGKEEKTSRLYNYLKNKKKTDKYLPKEILTFVEEDRIEQCLLKKDLCKNKNDRFRTCYDVKKETLEHYGKVLNNDDIIKFARGEFIFDEIISIESIGIHQTYDLSIPMTFNFVANDFITHNTETMVVESLFHASTKRNFRVLIITPYENQVRLAFMRINELIQESPFLKALVVSNTKNPYMVKFMNDSAILGFTTGASSGGGAASIRGQRADLIVMDEVDKFKKA